ncbi:MAG: RNB domain-containing ribonuclease [Deltaproteobacteria bacterium]|nr:RNB domain-containing ribonuclease [Deltaproteobacteria bacterium]MBW2530447.1 RNB domain-containing ribonuclease [Deltaproteobacteria bacterium]
MTAAFLGLLSRRAGAPGACDAFDDDAPWVPVDLDDGEAPEGSILAVAAAAEPSRPRAAEVLARPGTALGAVYGIAIDHALNPCFPTAVAEEVQALLAAPGIDDPALVDLTHLPFVTVDDADTRDLDQALFVERDGGTLVLWYALADASYYVRPTTALFAEALRRGASYYLPGLVVPMLPRALSEGLISLNEAELRRAFVLRIPVDGAGVPTGSRILRARIRSRAKLSFAQVEEHLDRPQSPPPFEPAVGESLHLLRELGERRMRLAEHRHVVSYRRSEVAVDLVGGDGLRFVAEAEPRGLVEQYNEQLSLLCNVEGARLLARSDRADDGVEPIYRVHPPPDEQRLDEFEALTAALAAAHGLDPQLWHWPRRGPRSLAEYLAALPIRGREGSVARAVHRQAVLLNLRSSFAARAAGHYGVGAEVYARFSSPMREVVGVFVHKEALERIGAADPPVVSAAAPPPTEPVSDDELRHLVIDSANRAKELQKRITRQANRLVLDQWFGEDLGAPAPERRWHAATVVGLTRSKVHALLATPPLDVKVYVRDLAEQQQTELVVDDHGVVLGRRGTGAPICRVGDEIEIRALRRDERRDRWALELRAPAPAAPTEQSPAD